MQAEHLKKAMASISAVIEANIDYLTQLDSQSGDGDLGISMSHGFCAVDQFLAESVETDMGQLLFLSSKELNAAAPSSLGTILSVALMGMAKSLRGKAVVSLEELTEAMRQGVDSVMEKSGSKVGEKTVLDSIVPAIEAMAHAESVSDALDKAAKAAAAGAEHTRELKAVHGRAAYYGEKSIGLIDGGAVVGKLIFEALAQCS